MSLTRIWSHADMGIAKLLLKGRFSENELELAEEELFEKGRIDFCAAWWRLPAGDWESAPGHENCRAIRS